MSSLIVDVCEIEEVKPHSNADALELVRVKNWWCVSRIGSYKVGDKVVYFPPDAVISEALAERFGIAKYCAQLPKLGDGTRPSGLRIRAARFRGEKSCGTVQPLDDPSWDVGTSVAEYYGVTKFEPPPRGDGDIDTPIEAFHKYTDIENINNFPSVFMDGEEVVVDEKIHGTNSRIGKVLVDGEWVYTCGSHAHRRKEFDAKGNRSRYWMSLTDNVKALLDKLSDGERSVVLFGEIYGPGVQDMHYGLVKPAFRAFDIAVDGNYLDHDVKAAWLTEYGIDRVPFIYRGPFSIAAVEALTDGPTEMCEPDKAGKFKGREGVVIRPVVERYSKDLPHFGRVILKSISVDYHERKGGTEFH